MLHARRGLIRELGFALIIMWKIFLLIFIGSVFSCSAFAQEDWDNPPLSRLRSDYNQVGIVARVKVKSVEFAAPDIHPLYLLQSEVVEAFKGNVKRGRTLRFYLSVEEGFDVNSRLGDWIVFLEGSANTPDKKWGWFVLENSSLPYSNKLVAKLRRIRNTNVRLRKKRPRTTHSTRGLAAAAFGGRVFETGV